MNCFWGASVKPLDFTIPQHAFWDLKKQASCIQVTDEDGGDSVKAACVMPLQVKRTNTYRLSYIQGLYSCENGSSIYNTENELPPEENVFDKICFPFTLFKRQCLPRDFNEFYSFLQENRELLKCFLSERKKLRWLKTTLSSELTNLTLLKIFDKSWQRKRELLLLLVFQTL